MKTSRIDGVKAPQHRGTPRSHLHRPAQRSLGVLRHAIALVEDDDLEGRARVAVELLAADGVRPASDGVSPETASKSKKRPPSAFSDGDESRRWREGDAKSRQTLFVTRNFLFYL